jgi:HK97 family phage portal protein
VNLRELLTGAPPQTLGLDAKGFAYPQQGGQGYGGVYYGSDAYSILNGLTRPTSRDYASVRIELSSALAVCLNTVCNAFPEAELCVEREIIDGEDEREPTHPALMLVERPNPYMSGADVLTAVVRDLMTSASGSAYLVKRRGAYKRVVELWPVCSSMMRPVWPASGEVFISAYEITIDGERRLIDPADVIHFRNDVDHASPSYSRCGIPYLPAVMQDLYTDSAAGDFTAAIMRNMGLPGAIISPKALVDGRTVTLSKEQRDEFAADYQARFTGAGRGRALVTGNPIDVHQLGFDPEKMSLRQIRQIAEERLSAIYNIPAIVAGFGAGLEHSTYANYEQALKAFWSGCIIPIQRRIATTLTQQLLRVDYPRSEMLYFEFEHDHIKALQESETEKRQRDREDYLAGILTHHQAVSRLGAVPEGDDWMVLPSSVTAYPVNAMPMAEIPEPVPPQLALPPAPEPAKSSKPYSARPGAVLDSYEMLVTDAVPGMTVHVTKADDPGTDEPLAWTDDQIEAESIITDEDLERAEATIRERSTTLGDFLDSPPVKNALPVETKESYRWNPRTRRYIGANGRMVPKAAVDAAVDEAVKASREVMAGYADRLISGDWSLVDYQLAMRDEIKTMHAASIATTRGGWRNLTPQDRGRAAKRIQEQYKYLDQSCRDFAKGRLEGALKPGQEGYDKLIHGRPLDGTARSSSKMYASSARSAFSEADYEAQKDVSEAQVDTHEERWIRHAEDSCSGCVGQADRKWVPLGALPPIGSQQCKTNCLCSKSVRKKSRRKDVGL